MGAAVGGGGVNEQAHERPVDCKVLCGFQVPCSPAALPACLPVELQCGMPEGSLAHPQAHLPAAVRQQQQCMYSKATMPPLHIP